MGVIITVVPYYWLIYCPQIFQETYFEIFVDYWQVLPPRPTCIGLYDQALPEAIYLRLLMPPIRLREDLRIVAVHNY